MKIIELKPNSRVEGLDELLREKYGSTKNYDFFRSDVEKALLFCTENDNVAFYPIAGHIDEKLVAHIALIVDKRLPKSEAFFGFMELPEDSSIFRSMWDALKKVASNKGVSILKGPVNGSIWHQYRAIKESDGSKFYKAEPICEPYYHKFLTANSPDREIEYFSAYRKPFDIVLQFIDEGALRKMEALGFSIQEADTPTVDMLSEIAAISRVVFNQSWGYTELNEREFMQLYSSDKMARHLDSIYLLYKGRTMIGFCSTYREDEETLVCKTICVLPDYQGLGLGNALAYKVHHDAKERGYKKMIYALIREGNNIKNFPMEGAVFFRRYSAFEFKL